MNIDFFTFGAQIINLLILLFLLRKFLYLPILKVLDERKAFLEAEYEAARKERKKAELLEQNMQREFAAIENTKQEIFAKTNQQAQELAQKLSDEARTEFEKSRNTWKNKLKSEQISFEFAIQELILQYFGKFTDGALEQMADVDLNELFLHKLKQKILEFNPAQKTEFIRDFLMHKELEVVTAKELKETAKEDFRNFLNDNFELPKNFKIKFSLDESIICGIALRSDDQTMEWNLAEYISEFKKNLNKAVSQIIHKD